MVGLLEKLAKRIEHEVLPTISHEKASIKRKVLWGDGIIFGLLGAALVTLTVMAGYWDGFTFAPAWWDGILADPILSGLMLTLLVAFRLRALPSSAVIPRSDASMHMQPGIRRLGLTPCESTQRLAHRVDRSPAGCPLTRRLLPRCLVMPIDSFRQSTTALRAPGPKRLTRPFGLSK